MLAVFAESVIAALTISYVLMGVGLFVPLLAGLFLPSATTGMALSSIVAGLGAALTVHIVGFATAGWVTPAVAGLIASSLTLGVLLAVSALFRTQGH